MTKKPRKFKNFARIYGTSNYKKAMVTKGLSVKPRQRFSKNVIFYTCDSCGNEGFQERYCPKCGLEAKDWKNMHTIKGD